MRRFAGTGLPTTYNTWDVRGKIISTVISGTTIAWEYDHRGLRVSRRGGIPNRYYIFAGSTLIGEIHGTTPAYAYTWGPDGVVSQRDIANTESYWYQFGPQGETRALVDDSASTVETYLYDAYGIRLSGSPTLYNPFKYGGKFGYYTEETAFGRILAGQRWYSPEHRRWISRDPIEYAGGDNLYAYVMGDPVNLYDNSGKNPVAIEIARQAGVVVGAYVLCKVAGYCDYVPGSEPLYTPIDPNDGIVGAPNGVDEAKPDKDSIWSCPRVPTEDDGFKPKKNWDGETKVRAPNGTYGYPDEKGNVWVWVPEGHPAAHGGEHWDVQSPDGGYRNVYPGGRRRGGRPGRRGNMPNVGKDE